jgi:DNA-binding response OmpR family regulator
MMAATSISEHRNLPFTPVLSHVKICSRPSRHRLAWLDRHHAAGEEIATPPVNVVVIEDAPDVARLIETALAREGFSVAMASDAERGLEIAREKPADVVIMDLALPGIDGIEACRQLRTFSDAYVIMLTGRDSEIDRLIGLSVGADDYVTKPFYARELVARIRAMQRRPRTTPGTVTVRRFGDLQIDPAAREVTVAGAPVELSRTEYHVLDALSSEPRVSISRQQLLQRVWGEAWFGDDHVIDVHISNLRRKLGDDPHAPRYVKTIRGYGYRMGTG